MVERYTHGYGAASSWMATRTAATEAAFLLPHLKSGISLLDCGCGPGTITLGLAEAVAPGQATGIDTSESEIENARALASDEDVANVRFDVASIYQLPFADATFDVVFTSAVLEHLSDPLKALVEMSRVLKPGGVVGLRHGDWDGVLIAPPNPKLWESLELYETVWRHNNGEARFGKHHRELLREAGLARTEASASYQCYGTSEATRYWGGLVSQRFLEANIVGQVTELGLGDRRLLEDMAAAWREWGEHPDAFFALTWCEAVGWKE